MMCLLRTLHFSIHDVRYLMTVEPFSRNDDAVFINPSGVEPHHCDLRLPHPIGDLGYVQEGFFATDVIDPCADHSCCVTSVLHRRCARCPGDSEFHNCPFFTRSNEYIPYESVMSPPGPGTEEAMYQVAPSWTSDIKPYPYQLYPGHPFKRREAVDAEAMHEFRACFFSVAGGIYRKRRDLATWIEEQHRCLGNEVFQTPKGIKSLAGVDLCWKLEKMSSTVREAQDLLSLAIEASEIAGELSRMPNSGIKRSDLWEPDEEGPLLHDLEAVIKQWENVFESWSQLNFGCRRARALNVSRVSGSFE